MSMYSMNFRRLLKNILSQIVIYEDLKSSLKVVAESVCAYYPDSKIWFTENFGKRHSYIVGAGKETYKPVQKLEYANNYTAFLQNLSGLNSEEKSILADVLNIVTIIHQG